MNTGQTTQKTSLAPTRRLNKAERDIFERTALQFPHLTRADEEQLTQYCEATVRLQQATKEAKKHPTVSQPIINRATGNVTGHKEVRNPAFVTLKEAQQQVVSLGRRLMIDAHSAEKRLRLQTKKARATAAHNDVQVTPTSAEDITEEAIHEEMEIVANLFVTRDPETLRQLAIDSLLHRDMFAVAAD